LEGKEELKIDAIIAKASIEVDQQQKINIYRKGFVEFPGNERLLDQYLGELIPVKKDTAKEVLEVVTKIKEHRQLLPEEYYNLGHAYLLLNNPEKAEEVFRSGVDRYPSMQRFLFDHAVTLYILGHEDKSYSELKRYIEGGKRDYSVLKNLAIVSENTGRTEEAIKFLSAALKKVTNDDEKGEIHCQLYELKRRKTFPPKDLLFHIVEYGKTTNSIPDLEARYLMLFMMAPEMPEYEKDPEVAAWVSDFRKRLKAFTTAYPNFKGLRVFSLPEAATGEQIRQEIMSTIAYMALPHDLATASIKIATRSGEWPTVFRAHYLYSKSIFDYWGYCIESKESQHAIHIWRPTNDLNVEATNAGEAHAVCIDITALLTLAQFDLLSALNTFEQIIMAWETKKTIEKEMNGFKTPNALTKKIYDWETKNKHKIRTRGIPDDSEEDYKQTASGLFMKTEKSIKMIFKDGIGETLLLAQKLGLPLYSDESYIRSIGESTYKTKTFSTLGLLQHLGQKKYVSLREETKILSQMIERNFMIIPFTPFHLQSRLDELLQAKTEGVKYIRSDDLKKDVVMMSFMGQFADLTLHDSMVRIALGWWLLLIDDPDMPDEQLAECMYYPIYSLSMQTKSTILGRKIYEDEQEKRVAGILALFLWHVYKKNKAKITKAWSAIKSSCTRYFPSKEGKVIFNFLLNFLKKYIEKDDSLNDSQKAAALFEISESIPFVDKAKFQEYFIKNKPAFIQ
jgi:tetratricopeptide (TPR) repeat protein